MARSLSIGTFSTPNSSVYKMVTSQPLADLANSICQHLGKLHSHFNVSHHFLYFSEKSFEEIKSNTAASSDSSSNQTSSVSSYPLPKPSVADADLLRLLLPALCHLTAEQEPRDLLRAQGAMEICGKYFSYLWKQFEERKDGEQPEVIICCFAPYHSTSCYQ